MKAKIISRTWKNDIYGLFDYENPNVSKQNFKIKATGKIFRENSKIYFRKDKETNIDFNFHDILFNIEKIKGYL